MAIKPQFVVGAALVAAPVLALHGLLILSFPCIGAAWLLRNRAEWRTL